MVKRNACAGSRILLRSGCSACCTLNFSTRRKTMKNHPLFVLSLLGLLLATGCAATWDKSPTPNKTPVQSQQPIPPLEARSKVTATAIVQAVDLDDRQLVLRGKGDSLHTIAVSEKVRNLSKIKTGDRIELTYYEALALALEKNAMDTAVRPGSRGIERGEPGQQPVGVVREDVQIVADVARIQQKARKVTLRSGQGVITLKAPKNIDISKFKVGDRVKAHYVPALAVTVQPVAIKSAKSSKAK
jgi:hypothetical protein